MAKCRQSKQIFEIDEELCDILIETDKVDEEIPTEIIDRLVYESFYVKLPEDYIRVTNQEGQFSVDGFTFAMTYEELKAAYEAAVQKCSELENEIDELKKSNKDKDLHIEHLEEQILKRNKMLFGQKSEKSKFICN